jgi:peroxiredoxin
MGVGSWSGTEMVGGSVPDFELPDQEGKGWRLTDHLTEGPVVLIFYRGDW